MAKLKHWRFWVSDFYGSNRVGALSGNVRRIYLELLAFEARAEGAGLVNDPGLLAKRLGLTPEEFKNAWREKDDPEGVSQFFDVDRRGRLINHACEQKLARDFDSSSKNSSKAKKAARARWDAPSIAPSNPPRNARMSDECLSDDLSSSEDGEEGQNGESSSGAMERHYSKAGDLSRQIRRELGCSHVTADECAQAGMTLENARGWKALQAERGIQIARLIGWAKSYVDPATVPEAMLEAETSPEAKRKLEFRRLEKESNAHAKR